MAKLGVTVETAEIASSGGVSTKTGTLFATIAANYGPETTQLVRSMGEFTFYYGPREGTTVKGYDALSAFFALGGEKAYISRALGASIAAAKVELTTTTTAKTLVVTAKWKGEYGNKIKYAILEESSKTKIVIYNPESEVLTQSPLFSTASEMLAWGKEKANETYIEITEGSGYSTGKTELVKAVSIAALSGGVNPTTTKATTVTAIELPPKTLGPGQMLCTVPTTQFEAGVWLAMAEQAQKTNRFALADMKKSEETKTSAEIKTEKETFTGSTLIGGYIAFFSTAVKAAGLTLGTERTVAASGVVAGLLAKVAATGQENQAPAGPRWPLSPFVLSFVNSYTESQMNELNEAGINNLTERHGTLCLFGDVTATLPSKDLIFYQYSASRERMKLVSEGEEIAEKFLFQTLDGRHQVRTMFQGELQSMCKKHWEVNSLYGANASEAAEVRVVPPVNTSTTEAEGQLNAELLVRISPVAYAVKILIVSVPITETV